MNLDKVKSQENIRFIDFVRLERESELQKKERVRPKRPKPLPKPKPKTEVKQEKMPNKDLTAEPMRLDLDLPLDLAAKGMLGDAMVGIGAQEVNTNVIPLSRVNPVYPRRAKMMKAEGYIQVEFTITKSGHVKDIEIVRSYPEGLFDTSARRALIRWTFKPKMEGGKAVPQRAGLTINYRSEP